MTENNNAAKPEQWGSRLGYILSTLGMSVGVGAVWRFPMMTVNNGGGAFVLAFIIITILVVIPAGWAESALGRKYGKGVLSTLTECCGKKGRALGWLMSITPMGLSAYYMIIIANIVMYLFYTVCGAPFLSDVEGFFERVNDERLIIYILVAALLGVAALITIKGVQKGIERYCKVMLPLMLVFVVIIGIRILMLPGIGKGISYYLKPDFSQLTEPSLWSAATGMALFAVGLGPGFLLTYGSYLDKRADLNADFLTVTVAQLVTCLFCGFAIIPATVLFGIKSAAGKGVLFQTLPLVFDQIPGGMIWFFLFMLALLFSGMSCELAQMELTVKSIQEYFGIPRKRAISIFLGIVLVLAVPCVWNDKFFAFMDNFVGNILYSITACGLALLLAWGVGAKVIREEWYNPTSKIQYGSWVDVLYKYFGCAAFIYFTAVSITTLF